MGIEQGDILFGKYRVLRRLGSGAFADVYLVEHERLRAQRALKLLRREKPGIGSTAYTDTAGRFELEAQLGAAHLEHPNLVSIYEYEWTKDALGLVMEYAAGGSLQLRLEAVGRGEAALPGVDEVARTLRELATALAVLHSRDVVHRDIKPSNILFHEDGRAMLADLGLAQVPGRSSSRGGSMGDERAGGFMGHPGTPPYMSPEAERQVLHLKPSSDIYGLGLVVYQMLTGRLLPNVAPDERWLRLPADTPDGLRGILQSMTDESPAKRPWDGQKLLDSLEAESWAEAATITHLRKEPEGADRRLESVEEKGNPANEEEQWPRQGQTSNSDQTRRLEEESILAEEDKRMLPEALDSVEREARQVTSALFGARRKPNGGRRPSGAASD